MNETNAAAPATGAFVKVEGKVDDQMPAVPFVAVAYGFVWLAVLAYVLVLGRGLSRVRSEIAELRRRLAGAGSSGGA